MKASALAGVHPALQTGRAEDDLNQWISADHFSIRSIRKLPAEGFLVLVTAFSLDIGSRGLEKPPVVVEPPVDEVDPQSSLLRGILVFRRCLLISVTISRGCNAALNPHSLTSTPQCQNDDGGSGSGGKCTVFLNAGGGGGGIRHVKTEGSVV